MNWKSFTFCFFMLALTYSTHVMANDSLGKLKGIITDKNTSEELIGVTVSLEGTKLGAASGLDGSFSIKNIPPGEYNVRVYAIGYKKSLKKVSIKPNEITNLNITLVQSSIMSNEIIVGASKYNQSKAEVPVTTTVVGHNEIDAQPIKTLDNVVESVPGVDLVRTGGVGASSLQIRGSNSFAGGGLGTRVIFLYDGFLMNSPDAGSVNWQTMMMDGLSQLEVIKGASSALYGSGAMGGVVNAIGDLPKEFSAKLTFSNGIYSYPSTSDVNTDIYPGDKTPYFYNIGFLHGNTLGDFAYNIIYNHMDDQGYRDGAHMLLNDLKVKSKYNLNSSSYIQLTTVLSYSEGGVPYMWNQESEALGYEDATLVYPNRNSDDIKQTNTTLIGLKYFTTLGKSITLENKLYFNREYYLIKYYPEYIEGLDYQVYGLGRHQRGVYDPNDPSTYNDSDARRYGFGSMMDVFYGSKHRFVFGGDFYYDDVISTQYSNSNSYTVGLFAQDEFKISERLQLTFSLRYDLNHVNKDEVTYIDEFTSLSVTEPIENKTLSQLSPRFAGTYQLYEDLSIRASVGRSFRAPTLAERFVTDASIFGGHPNGELEAERMSSYELGIFKQFSNFASLDLAIYLNNYDNLIESVDLANDPNEIVFKYINVSKARIWGIESSIMIKPYDFLSFTFGYNYMNAKDLSGDLGAARLSDGISNENEEGWLAYRPEHNFSFKTSLDFERLSLNYTTRYVSQTKAIIMNSDIAKEDFPGDYWVMNVSGRYKIINNFSINAAVKNLTNTQYEELEKYRAPVRSFHLGFEYAY